jgi:hypothetical protein
MLRQSRARPKPLFACKNPSKYRRICKAVNIPVSYMAVTSPVISQKCNSFVFIKDAVSTAQNGSENDFLELTLISMISKCIPLFAKKDIFISSLPNVSLKFLVSIILQ